MDPRRLEFRDDRSAKFWEVSVDEAAVTTRWGRIGTDGQTKTKDLGTAAKAAAFAAKQIAKKTAKGYAEPGGGRSASAPAEDVVVPDGTGDLADGDSVRVRGSSGRPYTLENVGGTYSCSCPAWLHQSLPTDRRTCKHLRAFRGEAAETERLGALPAPAASTSNDGPPLLLAHRWDARDPTGWWMSEKLDGVRAWWTGTTFLSRLGNEYLAPAWFTADLPDTPLDGELFGGRGLFQQTISVVRRAGRGDRWKDLRFLVFDAPEAPGTFEERMDHLRSSGPWKHARVLEHRRCEGVADLEAELARIEAAEGEGLMLRKPESRYVQGRSETLLKVKSFLDAEAKVVGHVAGKGRHRGRLGALRVELPDGTAFKVGSGFTDAQRESPPPAGSIVTFRYQELTDDGVPRFPTFVAVRTDFDWDAAVRATPAPRRAIASGPIRDGL